LPACLPAKVGKEKRNKLAVDQEDGVVTDLVCDRCADIVEQLTNGVRCGCASDLNRYHLI